VLSPADELKALLIESSACLKLLQTGSGSSKHLPVSGCQHRESEERGNLR
jgi:hypothetical protein